MWDKVKVHPLHKAKHFQIFVPRHNRTTGDLYIRISGVGVQTPVFANTLLGILMCTQAKDQGLDNRDAGIICMTLLKCSWWQCENSNGGGTWNRRFDETKSPNKAAQVLWFHSELHWCIVTLQSERLQLIYSWDCRSSKNSGIFLQPPSGASLQFWG